MTIALCLAALSIWGANPFPPAPEAFSPPPLVRAEVDAPDLPSFRHFGLMLDAGAPDGAGASLVFRPWDWLRFQAGGLTNSVSPGVRAGVTWVPFHLGVAPTLTVEGGHLFDGDANALVGWVTQNPGLRNPALSRFGYDFANAQLGIEFGPPDRWAFYVRAGVSYLRASPGLQQGIQTAVQQVSPPDAHVALDSSSGLFIPSAKLGVTFFIL